MPTKPSRNSEPLSRGMTTLDKNSTFQIVEAYKAVRTNLLFALAPSKLKSVIVTGAEPGSGKSTTCSNLAITMAQTGAKVVLIDADMRKPVQHKIFRVSNTKGLSKLLGGLSDLSDSFYGDLMPNLDLIPAGPIPPNPSELLGSERMAQLLLALAEAYDYIFIDTPPLNVVSDCLTLSDKTGGTLLVARQKQTHYEELQKAVGSLQNVGANVLGVVITDVSEANKPYGPYGSYKYKAYDYEYKKS